MLRYLLPLLFVVSLMAVILVTAGPKHERADFTFINRGSITTLDPAAMSWMQDIRLALTVWEGLSTYHPETTEPIPGCAFEPQISEDKRTYTFQIQPNARWHNGDPVTAHDFVYAWRRAFEPGTAADYAFFFDHIDGVKQYTAWRIEETTRIGEIVDIAKKQAERDAHLAEANDRFGKTVGIKALDDNTLQVRLVRPVAYFLDLTAFSIFLPVHRSSAEAFKSIGDNGLIYYNEQWAKPEHTLYNGPFYINEWKFKRHMRLPANPYYWDADAIKLKSIEMLDVDDPNTCWLMYAGGQVDWVSSLDMNYAPKLISSSASPFDIAFNKTGTERNDIHAFPAYGTYFYNFNCTEKLPDGTPNPFLDIRVRQAFTMAVDKQQLVDQVVRRGNTIATAFVPPGSLAGYPQVEGLPYDPQRARQLLAEAGYPDGRGFPEAVVLFNTGSTHGDIAQAIVGMWERALGVSGRVEGKEVKTFREDKKNVNYVICRASWYGDYGDPTTFLDMFVTGNGNNDSGFSDPKYDAILEEAEKEADPQKRLDMLADAETYLINDGLPLLPLYHYVNVFAFDPDRIRNLHLTPRMMTMMKVIEVTK